MMSASKEESRWIRTVDGVCPAVHVKIRIPTGKTKWVLGQPSARQGIVVSRSESYDARVAISEAARKCKRLEARRRVREDNPKLVVINPLRDRSGRAVYDESYATD